MGLTDAVSGAVDTASSALGGGGGGGGSKPEAGKPKFERKDPLDPPKDKKPLSVGPNGNDTPPNTAQPPDIIEFVHFGFVHDDTTNHYAHPKFDNEKDKKPSGRAILFRDALEREALLLFGFITAAKSVHEELKKNRGVAGEVAGAIGSLVGKSGSEPDPGSLKSLLDDVTKAGGNINAETCDYIKIHKAGIDFHQTRADFNKYCKEKLEAYYLKPGDDATSTLMSIPGVAGVAKTVFGILFKAFNIYFGIFLALRSAYEADIEKACYEFSIDIVKKYGTHTFSPWYAAPKQAAAPAASGGSGLPGPLAGAANAVSDAKKDVTDELGEPEAQDPAPGEGPIGELFGILGSGPSDDKDKAKGQDGGDGDKPQSADKASKDKPPPKPAGPLVSKTYGDVLGTPLPGPMATGVEKITWGNVEFLKAVYIKLCRNGPAKIDQKWLLATAHDCIFDKIFSLLEDTFSFIKDAKKMNMDVQGQKLGPEKLIDKGQDALKQKFGPYADSVLKLAIGKLADKLEDLRSNADSNKSLTMEIYLGALPYLLALQIRNTTFPVWDLVMGDLLGRGNAAMDAAMKPVRGMIGDARSVVDDVKDKKDRVSAAKDKFDREGLAAGSGGQNVSEYKDILFGDKPKPGQGGGGGGGFPGGSRTTAGTGPKIAGDDPDKAKNDRKDPWPK